MLEYPRAGCVLERSGRLKSSSWYSTSYDTTPEVRDEYGAHVPSRPDAATKHHIVTLNEDVLVIVGRGIVRCWMSQPIYRCRKLGS